MMAEQDTIKYAVTHTILALFYLVPMGMCLKRTFCSPTVEAKGDPFWQRAFSGFMLLGCAGTYWSVFFGCGFKFG